MATMSPIYMRMKQAVQWLKHERQMLQKDIAEKMGMTDVSFSRGMERIKHKNDDGFIITFQQATGEIFSLDWLLNGNGDKFAVKQSQQNQEQETPIPSQIDQSSLLNSIIAAKDDAIVALKMQSATKDKLIASLEQHLREKSNTVEALQKEAAAKDALISACQKSLRDKDELIKAKDELIASLRHQLAQLSTSASLDNYPFAFGAADKTNSKTTRKNGNHSSLSEDSQSH